MTSVESAPTFGGATQSSGALEAPVQNTEPGSLSAAISPSGPYDEAVLLIKVNLPKGEPIDVMVYLFSIL